MSEKKHTIIYSAEDIQEYLSGKLSPLQMNAMEKAALDDPFLAEAMEGYEGMYAGDWKAALTAAKQQFAEKESGAKVIALPGRKNNWLKIAVAVLLIGGTAIMTYFILNKKEVVQIAQTNPGNTSENQSTIVPETSRVIVTPTAPEIKSIENITVQKPSDQSAFAKKSKADSSFIYQPSAAKNDDMAFADKIGEGSLESKKISEAGLSSIPAPPAPIVSLNNNANLAETYQFRSFNKAANSGVDFAYDKNAGLLKTDGRKDQAFNNNFYAQVMAPDNTPLPFANISIKSENFGTYTDAKGNFRLASADSVLTVEVKSVGYIPKVYTIKSNLVQNKITLVEEDMAAKEKTVVNGYATSKAKTSRRATLVKDSVINVEPADGWDNYNTYVTNNIVIPDELIANNIHGQVELSFDVTENGNITNIKIDRSLCNNCDEFAKKLIEQGPQWKIKKGKKGKGKVTLQF